MVLAGDHVGGPWSRTNQKLIYVELTSSLLAATCSAFKTTGKKKSGKFNIPGWNSVIKSKFIKLQSQPSGYG